MIDYSRWPPAFSVSQNEVPIPMCTPENPMLRLCNAFGVCANHQRREPRLRLVHFRLPAEGVYHQRRRHNVTVNSQEGNRENSSYVDARGTLRHSITPFHFMSVSLHSFSSSYIIYTVWSRTGSTKADSITLISESMIASGDPNGQTMPSIVD